MSKTYNDPARGMDHADNPPLGGAQRRRPTAPVTRRAVGGFALAGLLATGGLWSSRPSTTELCGVSLVGRYAPAPIAEQSVRPGIVDGKPRWVCHTTFDDGTSAQSWAGRP